MTADAYAAFFPASVRVRYARPKRQPRPGPGWRDVLRWNAGLDWDWERPVYEPVIGRWQVRVG